VLGWSKCIQQLKKRDIFYLLIFDATMNPIRAFTEFRWYRILHFFFYSVNPQSDTDRIAELVKIPRKTAVFRDHMCKRDPLLFLYMYDCTFIPMYVYVHMPS